MACVRMPARPMAAWAFAAATILAACSQHDGIAPTTAAFALPAAAPQCKDQRMAKRYAQVKARLKTRGGAFCVPAFHDFSGAIAYPSVARSVELTLRSSTKDIYDEPQLGSGTAIFYLNLHFHAGTHFRKKLRAQGGLTGSEIAPGRPYTAFGIVAVGHLVLRFPPCYAVATQGPYGGVLANVGELFSDTTITGAGYGVIEIYSGEQVSQPC